MACVGSGEIVDGDGYLLQDSKGCTVERTIWVITPEGRAALHARVGLKAKREAGIVVEPEGRP